MSFVFGGFDTALSDGVTATLQTWPSMPGVTVETVDVPGMDGAFFAGSRLGQGGFVFDVVLQADTPAGVLALADQVSAACDQDLGLQDLTPEGAEGWVWRAVAAAPVAWPRGLWVPGLECQLRDVLSFQCPDPYGYRQVDELFTGPGPGAVTVNRQYGNRASFPKIEIQGALTVSQTVTLTVGGIAVQVTGPLTSGQVLRLDYQSMDFGVWAGATKVASAVPRMSRYDRLTLPIGNATVALATTGTVSGVNVWANSRRA
jgi:phage-related protein